MAKHYYTPLEPKTWRGNLIVGLIGFGVTIAMVYYGVTVDWKGSNMDTRFIYPMAGILALGSVRQIYKAMMLKSEGKTTTNSVHVDEPPDELL